MQTGKSRLYNGGARIDYGFEAGDGDGVAHLRAAASDFPEPSLLVNIVGLEVTTVFARVGASEIQLGAALRKVEAKLAGTCTVAIRGVEEGALV